MITQTLFILQPSSFQTAGCGFDAPKLSLHSLLPGQDSAHQPLVARTQPGHAQIVPHEGQAVPATNPVGRQRPCQLGEILYQPAAAEAAAVLHPLQIDKPNLELPGDRFAHEEMARIKVAVIVAGLMKRARDLGDLTNQAVQIATATPRNRRAAGGKPLGNENWSSRKPRNSSVIKNDSTSPSA